MQVNVSKEPEGNSSRFTFRILNDLNNTISLSIEAQERQDTSAASTAIAQICAANPGDSSIVTVTSVVNSEERTQSIVEYFDALGSIVQRESCTDISVAKQFDNDNDRVVSVSGLSDAAANFRTNAALLPDNVTAFVVVASGVDTQVASSVILCIGYAMHDSNLIGNAQLFLPAVQAGLVVTDKF